MTFKVNSSVSCDFPEGCSAFIACDHANACEKCQGKPPKGFTCNACEVSG